MLRRRHVLVCATAVAAALPAVFAPAALAERFVAVDSKNRLYTFDDKRRVASKPSKPLSGLAAGDKIVGLDVRPANRQLVALTNTSRLYVVSRSKASATAIGGGPFTPALIGSGIGFDFNPTVDRIRAVSAGGQNLRLNPDTGAAAFTDRPLRYKDGDAGAGIAPVIAGSAYTNSRRGAMETVLYGIDSGRDTLVFQSPPNEGVLSTVGPLGVNLAGPLSFDISPLNGKAYVLARRARSAGSRLFRINLGRGTASQAGVVRGAPSLVAFAALTQPAG